MRKPLWFLQARQGTHGQTSGEGVKNHATNPAKGETSIEARPETDAPAKDTNVQDAETGLIDISLSICYIFPHAGQVRALTR